jgi:transcriptional regulator with XRE-family HTH domain
MFLTADDLLRLRKKARLSHQALGKKVGVTRRTIANWEIGIGSPSFNQVVMICLGCSIDSLFFMGLVLARKDKSKPLDFEQKEDT